MDRAIKIINNNIYNMPCILRLRLKFMSTRVIQGSSCSSIMDANYGRTVVSRKTEDRTVMQNRITGYVMAVRTLPLSSSSWS